MESKKRSIIKSITWRACATITTILLVFIFTKNINIAVSLGAIEIFVKMIVYYGHERAWSKSRWGLN